MALNIPRIKILCAHCKEQGIDASVWIDAINIMSMNARDAHVQNPESFSDQCRGFFVIAQKGMFNDILSMELDEINQWADAIDAVALEAPFDNDVYINVCRDVEASGPIDYDKLMEAYEGKFESFADFAKAHYDYMREDIPSFFYDYIDWEGISHKLERRGYFYYADFGHPREVHVFNSGLLKGNNK